MEIIINGSVLDASLENENTLGEVLTGLEQWLSSSGHRIAELKIDGELISASMIEAAFSKEVKTVKCIEVETSVLSELAAAGLLNLIEDIKEYENLQYEEKQNFFSKWKAGATARFIEAEMPDLFAFCGNAFSGGDVTPQTLLAVTEEIQREVNDPENELVKLEPVLDEICGRLVELPLDIQTGKDARAAQTMQIFSAVTEKIFRIFKQLNSQGYLSENKEEKNLERLFSGFENVLRELLDAYEKSDSVLVGDLAEYEASPKIKELYNAIIESVEKSSNLQGEK